VVKTLKKLTFTCKIVLLREYFIENEFLNTE